jgi:hypothetical protein
MSTENTYRDFDQGDLRWFKSSKSNGSGGNCVEAARLPDGGMAVRDSKAQGNGPVLFFTAAEWNAFVGGVHDGEFEQ